MQSQAWHHKLMRWQIGHRKNRSPLNPLWPEDATCLSIWHLSWWVLNASCLKPQMDKLVATRVGNSTTWDLADDFVPALCKMIPVNEALSVCTWQNPNLITSCNCIVIVERICQYPSVIPLYLLLKHTGTLPVYYQSSLLLIELV